MNLEELKTVLTDIVSSLEMVLQGLQSGDQTQTEEPAEALIESLNKAKAILAKEEEPEDKPKDKPKDEPKDEQKKDDEDVMKTLKELIAAMKGQPVQKSAVTIDKGLSDRLETIEKGFSEILKGFGVAVEPAVVPVQKGLNQQSGQGDLIDMLADAILKKSGDQPHSVEAGANPIRKNRDKLGGLAAQIQAQRGNGGRR